MKRKEKIALLEAFGLKDKSGNPLQLKAILHASGMAAMSTMLLGNLKAGQKVLTHFLPVWRHARACGKDTSGAGHGSGDSGFS